MAEPMRGGGGPAFPVPYEASPGMTLRDWFVGQMLVAMPHMGCGADLEPAELAADAYRFADAMIVARERAVPQPQVERERDEATRQRDSCLAALRNAQTMLDGALVQRDKAQADCIDAADLCRMLMDEVKQLRTLLGMNPAPRTSALPP